MSATGFRRSEPTEFLKYVVRTKGQNTDLEIHFNGVNFFNQKGNMSFISSIIINIYISVSIMHYLKSYENLQTLVVDCYSLL